MKPISSQCFPFILLEKSEKLWFSNVYWGVEKGNIDLKWVELLFNEADQQPSKYNFPVFFYFTYFLSICNLFYVDK